VANWQQYILHSIWAHYIDYNLVIFTYLLTYLLAINGLSDYSTNFNTLGTCIFILIYTNSRSRHTNSGILPGIQHQRWIDKFTFRTSLPVWCRHTIPEPEVMIARRLLWRGAVTAVMRSEVYGYSKSSVRCASAIPLKAANKSAV